MQVKQTLDEACIKENNDILLFFHFICMDTPENKQVIEETDIDETAKGVLRSLRRFMRAVANRVLRIGGITTGGTERSEGAVQQHPDAGDILVQLGPRGEKKIYAATLRKKGWWKNLFTLDD